MNEKFIVIDGETYDEALINGLKILNLAEDQVTVEILEEKKGFLFKKAVFKLKIEPLIQNNNVNTAVDNIKPNNYSSFKLEYNPDGVYIIVLNKSALNIGDILDLLTRKSVKDYDHNMINIAITSSNNISIKIAPQQEEIILDSFLEIEISNNKQEVFILLTEPFGGKILTFDQIVSAIKSKGIKIGIDHKKIEQIVNDRIFNENMLVARGIQPINGENGKIIYGFEDDVDSDNIFVEEDDGRVDYKNLNKIRNVHAGKLLIEIIPPTDGIKGIDIFGKEVEAKKGTQPSVKKGKNVVQSEDGLKYYASKDGEVHFANDNVYVDEILNIEGNVDNETGNIAFNGKVNIKGNVMSGFKVEAEGDIEVWGVVEGATVISKNNITIHRGVQGNNQADLYCSGNLKAKYLENAKARSGGNIEADAILHSEVVAKDKIIVIGKKGLIVGGEIRAGQEVRARVVGSNMGTSTKIEVGIDPEEKNHYEKLKNEITDIEKNLENAKKAVDLLNKMSKNQNLTKQKQDLLVKSLQTYKVLRSKYDTVSKELHDLAQKFANTNKGKIHVSSIVYSGVRVIIGNSPKQIYDELSNCTLYIKDGEISVGPYEK